MASMIGIQRKLLRKEQRNSEDFRLRGIVAENTFQAIMLPLFVARVICVPVEP